jgi:hypothetical protein
MSFESPDALGSAAVFAQAARTAWTAGVPLVISAGNENMVIDDGIYM